MAENIEFKSIGITIDPNFINGVSESSPTSAVIFMKGPEETAAIHFPLSSTRERDLFIKMAEIVVLINKEKNNG